LSLACISSATGFAAGTATADELVPPLPDKRKNVGYKPVLLLVTGGARLCRVSLLLL
jgi:hypothetical protein